MHNPQSSEKLSSKDGPSGVAQIHFEWKIHKTSWMEGGTGSGRIEDVKGRMTWVCGESTEKTTGSVWGHLWDEQASQDS